MAFEALLAEYEARRAKALPMAADTQAHGGGAWNARERTALPGGQGHFIESGLRLLRVYPSRRGRNAD
jgi:hypothetical protein